MGFSDCARGAHFDRQILSQDLLSISAADPVTLASQTSTRSRKVTIDRNVSISPPMQKSSSRKMDINSIIKHMKSSEESGAVKLTKENLK